MLYRTLKNITILLFMINLIGCARLPKNRHEVDLRMIKPDGTISTPVKKEITPRFERMENCIIKMFTIGVQTSYIKDLCVKAHGDNN